MLSHEKSQREELTNALDASKHLNISVQEGRDEALKRIELLETALNQALTSVQSLEAELQRVYGSRSWRYFDIFRRFRHFVNRLKL